MTGLARERNGVDTKRLQSFVKIVDTGSLTRAADILNIAQPALSQQLAALETQFKQRLLVRSKQGVTPTDAGRALYRHAQLILRQIDQAQSDVSRSATVLSGNVSVGLAPYSTASTIALALLKAVRAAHPDIVLYINENFGSILSEHIMNGRLDMAVIYGAGPMRGVSFEPLHTEELFLIAPPSVALPAGDADIAVTAIAEIDLLLPSSIHILRKAVMTAFARAKITPRVIAEIESVATLGDAIAGGVAATILPWSMVTRFKDADRLVVRRVTRPVIEVPISMCISDQLPMSDSALAVHGILLDLVRNIGTGTAWQGIKPTGRTAAKGT
jgi:LysR family transcriptional regulator, nitrogen assimilation regulatory protein